METLPQELINRIVWFAERYPGQDKWFPAKGQSFGLTESPSQFPRLASLNRLWKEAIETITFRSLEIKSDDLDSLQSIVTGNRRKYVAKVSFTPLLPEYSDEACSRRESRTEQRSNDDSLSQGIRALFTVLKAWEDGGVQSALQLNLNPPISPTDLRIYINGQDRENLMYDIAVGKRKDILTGRWEKSRLQFVKRLNLPILSNVQQLDVEGNGSRRLKLCTGPELAISLPNLDHVVWNFHDSDAEAAYQSSDEDSSDLDSDSELEDDSSTRSSMAREDDRAAFADRLSRCQSRSLNSVKIAFYHAAPFDQRRESPSLVPVGLTYDPFSAALRIVSQNLTTLTLDARLDSSLFWPAADEHHAKNPSWPHLKSLDITFNMIAPYGKWYFTGPRPVDHEDDDAERGIIGGDDREYSYMDYRVYPDPLTFDPFLAAFAKAVAEMPVLEYFLLTSELAGGKLHISYHAPGKAANYANEFPEHVASRRIYYACDVGRVWIPEPKTAEALRGAGKEKFGGEAIERYLGSQY